MSDPLDDLEGHDRLDLAALEAAARMLRQIADDPDYQFLDEWRAEDMKKLGYAGRPTAAWSLDMMFRTADRLDSLRFRFQQGRSR